MFPYDDEVIAAWNFHENYYEPSFTATILLRCVAVRLSFCDSYHHIRSLQLLSIFLSLMKPTPSRFNVRFINFTSRFAGQALQGGDDLQLHYVHYIKLYGLSIEIPPRGIWGGLLNLFNLPKSLF